MCNGQPGTSVVRLSDEPTCKACGTPLIEHLGLQGTCAELSRVTGERDEAQRLERRYKAAIHAMTGYGANCCPCEQLDCGGCESDASPLCDEYLHRVVTYVCNLREDREAVVRERDAAVALAREALAILAGDLRRHEATINRDRTYEDARVRDLGIQIGYGAMMSSAAHLWAKLVHGGEFVVGECATTLRVFLARPDVRALMEKGSDGQHDATIDR
jgi:hypothetical protein